MTQNRPVILGRRALLAVLAALSMLSMILGGGAFAQIPPPSQVTDIAVVGNVNISRDAILGAATATKVGQQYSPDLASRDVAAIRDLGYFQRVSYHTDEADNGIRVIFEVVENPKITSIVFTGNTLVPSQKLIDTMTTKVGDVLNTTRFGKDLDRIQDYYKNRGYFALVDIDQNNYITPEGVLRIPIKEVTIEGYRIVGNKKTKTNVIQREIRTPVGAPFNSNRLTEDLNRIYNQGNVEPQEPRIEPGSSNDKVIVVIPVNEKKTGQVEVGVGYSSQQGLIGRLGITEPNFRGTGQGVSASMEIGGRYRSSGIPAVSAELSYFQPYLDRHRTSLSASIYNRTSYRFSNAIVGSVGGTGQAYEVRRGVSLGLARPLSGPLTLQYSARTDSIRTYAPQSDINGTQFVIDTERNSTVSSVGSSLLYDTRDTPFDPAKGYYATLGAEFGITRLGGDSRVFGDLDEGRSGAFSKPALDLRRYVALKPRKDIRKTTTVLATRVKLGTATGPLSFFDQYFIGGADSLRGYSEDRFWGKNQLLINVEYRQPIGESLQVVLFGDAGDAWGSSLRGNPKRYANFLNWASHPVPGGNDSNGDGIPDPAPPPYSIYDAYEYERPQHAKLDLHGAFGVGIRVKTPIGPLRFDYGISKEGGRTHFSISQTF